MTPEEKRLLLIDLCARLPYGVVCTDLRHGDSKITEVDIEDGLVYCFDFDEYVKIENCRLYLRPLSSMTEEEENELVKVAVIGGYNDDSVLNSYIITDWLIAHHFDYRGLIPMGLAIEAPVGMYEIE